MRLQPELCTLSINPLSLKLDLWLISLPLCLENSPGFEICDCVYSQEASLGTWLSPCCSQSICWFFLHVQTAVLVGKKATMFSVGFVILYITFPLLPAKPLLWALLFNAGQGQVSVSFLL